MIHHPFFIEARLFDDNVVAHHRDKLYKKLFEPTTDSFDIITQPCLQVLFHVILVILERQCIDQLPGGKYWNTTDSIKSMAQNVLSTNIVSEGGFGMIDLLMRTRPDVSVGDVVSKRLC